MKPTRSIKAHNPDKSNFSHFLRRLWLKVAHVPNETLAPEHRVLQAGQIYAIYRIAVGLFFILSNRFANESIKITGIFPHSLPFDVLLSQVEYVSLGIYLLFGSISVALLFFWQKKIREQLLIGFCMDMIILTLLLYSGTGSDLQILLLYMTTTAASFIILNLSHAIIITFLAILSLIFQQLFYSWFNITGFISLLDAVMISMALIAVGFLSWMISQRVTVAENTAYKKAKEVDRLNVINDSVIQNIVSGIMVVSKKGSLLVINKSAERLLRLKIAPTITKTAYLFEVERNLVSQYQALMDWCTSQDDSVEYSLSLPQIGDLPAKNIRIHKKYLHEFGRLLILEDVSREESHAQQLKLASLGQLSASIAHEIRNPLGAISQASELLMEFNEGENCELYEMIFNQTKRVNRIIEDVMRLSSQEIPKQTVLDPKTWLNEFLAQYFMSQNIATDFDYSDKILFDPNHLEQILTNLINNALRHTKPLPNQPDVIIKVGQTKSNIHIDVMDNGDGVDDNDIPNLFHPFFTKSQGGTGLGLYLSKAFSEANKARLIYIHAQKTCFRLIIPTIHPFDVDI